MKILLCGVLSNVQGPLPKIIPLLVDVLHLLEHEVVTRSWGRRREHESLWDRITGRIEDIKIIHQDLQKSFFDVFLINTSHDWRAALRDIPLLLSTRGRCRCIVLFFHGSMAESLVTPGNRIFKIITRWLLKLSDGAFLLSFEEQRQWKKFYPAGKFYVVVNPYVSDTSRVHNTRFDKFTNPQGVPILLYVGRLIEEKGIFDLLQATALLKEQNRFHLIVAGDGDQAQVVQEQVLQLGLSDYVTLAGYLGKKELNAAYHYADIFVLPTYWPEGLPMVLLEAISAGLPIVTTPIRGALDHLKEGVNTLFVPPHDPSVLAQTLSKLLNDPDLRARMREANLEKVKEFAPDVVARSYYLALEQIINGNPKT